jgi:hypothetical protein
MAERVRVRGSVDAKIRRSWAPMVLAIVTLGIYYLVWYYKINRELRDYGRATGRNLGDSPVTSLLAVSLGALILVPPFVSWFNTFGRIRDAEEVAGVTTERTNVWMGLLFFIIALFFLPVETLYAQYQLNRVWRTEIAPAAALPA